MPKGEEDDLFEDNDLVDGDPESGDADPAPEDDNPADDEASNKRINDLMSRAQKAEAENAKLLKQLSAKDTSKTKGAKAQPQNDEFMEFAKAHVRNTLHASDPRFTKYGLAPDIIRGDSPEEMQASYTEQRKLLDSLESRIRNEALTEHGIDPSIASSEGRAPKHDFGAMTDEDFQKLLERRSSY